VVAKSSDAKRGKSRTIPGKDAGDLKILAELKNGYLR
jgi:hypothetical protein